MKKIENTFAVTGFVGKDAEIRSFTNASVARFSLAIGRQEKSGDQTSRVSAFLNFEAWRKNDNKGSFEYLAKGTLLTVEGYFKPERWTDKDGIEHNSITMVAVKFYPAAEKEEAPADELIALLEAPKRIYIRIHSYELANEYVSFRTFSNGVWNIK